jgi:hypothetical protein
MASRFDFHGLVIETGSALPSDPAALLLAALPTAPEGSGAELTIRLRPGQGDALVQRLPGPDAFTYGASRLRIAGGLVELAWPGALLIVDGPRVQGFVDPAMLQADGGDDLIAHGPILMALAIALRALGCYHLHAAGLVLPGLGTILVPALSGSGKSTLATALVMRGAGFLGDDTLFVRRHGEETRLLALPRDFHLTGRSAEALGLSTALFSGKVTLAGKGRLDAEARFPRRSVAEAAEPAVILLPSISGEPSTRLAPAGPSEVLGVLLESSALVATRGLPGGPSHLPLLAGLANDARGFHARLGLDLLSDPAGTAERLLARLAP